ncbi:MAG TPA: helicase HerA-like domain-containing protein [candidate division Zixibacteria bacterium]|nr:helicase HerA-like domain-containing protein [candidate division Zixibacteria bacterium]
MSDSRFLETITDGYGFEGPSVGFGAAMHEGETLAAAPVRAPLAMLNRHGLVAGATGTGKTKTLQVLAEQLSLAGVPCFISDIKGDISGLGAAAEVGEKLTARVEAIGLDDYTPQAFPVEFMTLVRDKPGVRLRASVGSFGPILLAKVMELNETQQSVLALAFKYAEDRAMALINLDDLRALLNHLTTDEAKAEMAEYGGVATATVGVIVRKIVELEQQDADAFFGAPEFDVNDLLRTTPDGKGIISVLELADMQDRPALFSTFMMWLLARLYETLPEVGDPDKPKLVFFFDEAHLLFRDANRTFLQQVALVARLIRSKGVGVFFVTHSPSDVPGEVLGQLGNRVQHALRAFTPDDLEVVRATAKTFPVSEFYDVERELTQLGIGEALVTALNPKGVPTPTVRTLMRPPMSLMAQLEPAAFTAVVAASGIAPKYANDLDPESAAEAIGRKRPAASDGAPDALKDVEPPAPDRSGGAKRPTRAPERGVDWQEVAREGARFARSGAFNTILRAVLRILGGRR